MKEFNLLLAGHWDININVEADSKEEAIRAAKEYIDQAIELSEELSGLFNITHDKQWIEGEEGVEKCPDCGNLKIPSTERFLQRGKSDIAH